MAAALLVGTVGRAVLVVGWSWVLLYFAGAAAFASCHRTFLSCSFVVVVWVVGAPALRHHLVLINRCPGIASCFPNPYASSA